MTFRSSVGKLWLSFLASLFSLCAIFFAAAYGTDADTTLFVLLGSTFLFAGVFCIILLKMIVYIFEKDGIRLNRANILAYMSLQEFIPYTHITGFRETREIGLTYGFSLDKVWIEFINDSGKKDGVGVSPKDKRQFISELTRRTGISISTDPYPG